MHGTSFYPLLVSFRLQIANRKVRNSQIGINKLVGQVSINLLHHAKFIMSASCVISITCCVKLYTKQIDLQAFLLLQLPYCVS